MAHQHETAPQQAGKRRVSVHDAQAKGAKCIGPKLVVLTGQDVAKRNPGGGREALSDEERRAVEGLLSYDEGLASPSRNMAWSPAKCSDWQVRRDCYYGAAAIESPRRPSVRDAGVLDQLALSTPAQSPAPLNSTNAGSTSWMRESVVRDLLLLEHEETNLGQQIHDESLQHFATPISPLPEEVAMDDEDSTSSTAVTTPIHGHSPLGSDHAASPDCEAIPEEEHIAFGFSRKGSSPLPSAMVGDGEAWAQRSGRMTKITESLATPVEAMPQLSAELDDDDIPVYRFGANGSSKGTTAQRPHVPPATAAAGSARKKHPKILAQRSYSASGQRSPEARLATRQSPSPSLIAGAESDDDKVINFGNKKYTIGGRSGVAPWQERGVSPTQKTTNSAGGAHACPSDTQLASALLRQQQWRTNRAGIVKGCVIKTASKTFNSGSIAPAAAAAASRQQSAAAAAKVVPSIPTFSQCAETDVGGLGVGGRALVGRSDVRCRVGGGGGASGGAPAASRKELKEAKMQHFNVNMNIGNLGVGSVGLAGKGGCVGAPVKRALTGAWGIGNRGTAAAGGLGPTASFQVK